MKIWVVLVAILLTATTTFGASSNEILGSWLTEDDDSLLEFFKCGQKICGKIVWLKHPNYMNIKDGPVGKIKVDRKNPNPGLRTRPILGMQVMKELTYKGNNRWGNGSCYDPETGKSYKCKMQMTSHDRLELRGYIGISLIGRNYTLTRK
jgi:uncharacterized protein (DUF2147 family)